MPRRKELKCVGNGILGSFVSRNNSVGGYWALGKLYSLARKNRRPGIRLDLVVQQLEPYHWEFDRMVALYSNHLWNQVSERKVPHEWIQTASLCVDFNVKTDPTQRPPYLRGDPYLGSIELITDRGRKFRVTHRGWCDVHSPNREWRQGLGIN